MNIIIKIISLITLVLFLFSCRSKLDQNSMFTGRNHKNKKGILNTGLNGKKSISGQISKEYDKLSKHDTKPKKAAKKAAKILAKKKKVMAKQTAKFVKKKKLGTKIGKTKSSGDK